jgi:7-cyano-7-deazaguanine synthase
MGTVVLLSGGVDSAACAVFAQRFLTAPVVALYVQYGSAHEEREMSASQSLATQLGLTWHTGSVQYPQLVHSPLLMRGEDGQAVIRQGDLCFVPGRNVLLLTLAAAVAYSNGWDTVVFGAHLADYRGYPDCRPRFTEAMQHTLQLALDSPIRIEAPLLFRERTLNVLRAHGFETEWIERMLCENAPADAVGKSLSFALLDVLGYAHLIEQTHSCYAGVDGGCGQCATCHLREQAFAIFQKFRRRRISVD